MNKSLLFIPDISGYTEFVQNTEVEHSQHVIAELLEVLIEANTENLTLAEIEGDALFFYKEDEIPSLEKLLAQVETMFTAFYGHLKLLETNRICPCNACATAPGLQLKIIIHSGELQFINVQNNRKPFGSNVIEAHRLMKNSIGSNNYVLITNELKGDVELSEDFESKLFSFNSGSDVYDGKSISYIYSEVDKTELKIKTEDDIKKVKFDKPADIVIEKEYPISHELLFEYISNLVYREKWVRGVDNIEYKINEVNRVGAGHKCIINSKELDFTTVTKDPEKGELIYGEMTSSAPIIDKVYQFYLIESNGNNNSKVKVELYYEVKSIFKNIFMKTFGLRLFKKNVNEILENLYTFIKNKEEL